MSTNEELDNLAKKLKIPNYVNCRMKNELTNKIKDKECGIVNFQNSNQNGSHWVCYFKKDDLKIYFDSFGGFPPENVKKYLGKNIICSNFQIQPNNSDKCGIYCLLVLLLLSKNYDYIDILLSMLT